MGGFLKTSAQIKTPTLFGFIRPRLLLPKEMLEEASHEEMQYIFLHELAHLKRLDIYLGWLTSVIQILHWFNPSMGYSSVWIIPAGGGEARELCRPSTMMYGVLYSALNVHSDGRHIAFDCFEYRHEVWAMENFLPVDMTTAEK